MTAGAFLRKCREKAGFSQDQLAEMLNKNQSDISKLEKDKRTIDIFTFRDWTMLTNHVEQGVQFIFSIDPSSLIQTALQAAGVA